MHEAPMDAYLSLLYASLSHLPHTPGSFLATDESLFSLSIKIKSLIRGMKIGLGRSARMDETRLAWLAWTSSGRP